MTPTEKARRSDALYYETVSVNRRVLCDMIANRESDLEDARAESEHMRLKALAVTGELEDENERLEAENAKLRELAAGIGHLLFTLDVDYCATCPKDSINHSCPVYTVDGGECLYKTDLRDLGVEVDE